MSKISDSNLLAMVLGGKQTVRVYVQPAGGSMVNMNIVADGKVSLHGICAPYTDFDAVPKSGVQYDIDAVGNMTICKDAVEAQVPASTMGCSMRKMTMSNTLSRKM